MGALSVRDAVRQSYLVTARATAVGTQSIRTNLYDVFGHVNKIL